MSSNGVPSTRAIVDFRKLTAVVLDVLEASGYKVQRPKKRGRPRKKPLQAEDAAVQIMAQDVELGHKLFTRIETVVESIKEIA